jgi:hypothetical protein
LRLFYGALIIYSISASLVIPELPGGGRGSWWNNECVFANWREIGPIEFATNEAVYTYYSGRPVVLLRKENSSLFAGEYESGRAIRMGLDYYTLHYTTSPIPGMLLQDYGSVMENGGVLTVETGIAEDRRYIHVLGVSGYR